ncbi:hypothetical protein J2Z32_002503 [Paenibacillus turicensis]|uniref:Fibronectin type-III domain-containing protein n=1 Tax=Paenibacillus turicensis TaxID=160487 RepID=A0ABS4FTF2_9BACL|nr:fibronectin type III domain-containing protein [Paenibacillus turicensis]MBP1905855.1 hypothetical protein [Paenibacillus turicensis]
MKKKVALLLFLLLICIPNLNANASEVKNTIVKENTIDGMLGFSPPEGTVAKGNTTYPPYTADRAIDKSLDTYWNSGKYVGSLELEFPTAIELDFIQVATSVRPAAAQTYKIYGLVDQEWKVISDTVSASPVTESANILNPFKVNHGLYNGIKLEVTASSSWIAISEITLGIKEEINLSATSLDSSVKLNWNSIENADSYKIQYGTEPNKYTSVLTASKDSYSNFLISQLTNGTKYYFQVTAVVNGVETIVSNEASATPQAKATDPDPQPEPGGDRAILTVTMTTGLEKEFDLSISEVNDFINWYDAKENGTGPARYGIDKHNNNKGPFTKRVNYIIFKNILSFEVDEYTLSK